VADRVHVVCLDGVDVFDVFYVVRVLVDCLVGVGVVVCHGGSFWVSST